MGVLSYEAGHAFEPAWPTQMRKRDPLRFPVFFAGEYDAICALDHARKKIIVSLSARRGDRYETLFARAEKWLSVLLQKQARATFRSNAFSLSAFQPDSETKSSYLKKVRRIQDYIAAGDIYQANFSQRFKTRLTGSDIALYARLREKNPAPYSTFLRHEDWRILSLSPEQLLKKCGAEIETRPIAGTRPRGKNQTEDAALEGELLLSPKERAEHVMLLDLERNDLGRVSASGSVYVAERMAIERYAHVMHIVSLVRGKIKKGEDIFSALEALFPGGTITGCPKVRCLKILDALEPYARGPFYGSAGWINFSGDGEWNLLIRSAVLRDQKMWIQTGSGIVADSKPHAEFDETLHKAAHFRALAQK
jgi:anthranilate/para-aminobenzoate synthase component I